MVGSSQNPYWPQMVLGTCPALMMISPLRIREQDDNDDHKDDNEATMSDGSLHVPCTDDDKPTERKNQDENA